jgi:hypothetical protein
MIRPAFVEVSISPFQYIDLNSSDDFPGSTLLIEASRQPNHNLQHGRFRSGFQLWVANRRRRILRGSGVPIRVFDVGSKEGPGKSSFSLISDFHQATLQRLQQAYNYTKINATFKKETAFGKPIGTAASGTFASLQKADSGNGTLLLSYQHHCCTVPQHII